MRRISAGILRKGGIGAIEALVLRSPAIGFRLRRRVTRSVVKLSRTSCSLVLKACMKSAVRRELEAIGRAPQASEQSGEL